MLNFGFTAKRFATTLVFIVAATWSGEATAQAVRPVVGDLFQLSKLEQSPVYRHAEPFGLERSTLTNIGLRRKWQGVEQGLTRENGILARCRADHESCPPAAEKFLTIIDKALTREGLARIGEVNRAVNLLITPVEDLAQHGVADYWATPLATFASGKGDCEDFAIAKYVALREAGIAAADLRLVVVYDRDNREYHAVAAARYNDHWLILDNRHFMMREDAELAHYQPLFLIDGQGVRRLVPPKHKHEIVPAAAVATATVEESPYSWWVDFTM